MAAHNRVVLKQRLDCKCSTTYLYETTKQRESEETMNTAASEHLSRYGQSGCFNRFGQKEIFNQIHSTDYYCFGIASSAFGQV
jgi:hypothetical protein